MWKNKFTRKCLGVDNRTPLERATQELGRIDCTIKALTKRRGEVVEKIAKLERLGSTKEAVK